MADFAAQAPPTSVTNSPAPSVGAGETIGDSPYHSIVQDAQSGLMEKVQAEVEKHYRSPVVEKIRKSGGSLTIGPTTVRLAQHFGFC